MAYRVHISSDIEFVELVYNRIIDDGYIAEINYGLEPNKVYYWRVKNINTITGQESEWSEICIFKTRPEDVVIGINNGTINNIIFECGLNKINGCVTPNGIIGEKLCRVGECSAINIDTFIGGDTLGNGLDCSELL